MKIRGQRAGKGTDDVFNGGRKNNSLSFSRFGELDLLEDGLGRYRRMGIEL